MLLSSVRANKKSARRSRLDPLPPHTPRKTRAGRECPRTPRCVPGDAAALVPARPGSSARPLAWGPLPRRPFPGAPLPAPLSHLR